MSNPGFFPYTVEWKSHGVKHTSLLNFLISHGGHRQKEGGASQEANGGKQVILSHKLLVKQGSSNPTGKQELRGA